MRCVINYIVHATEDMERIRSTLEKSLDIEIDDKRLRRSDVSGHFGNPITYVKISYRDRDANRLLSKIIAKLDDADKLLLRSGLEDHFEKRKFFIRLDKQGLCKGKIKLSEADAVRIMFSGVSKELLIKLLSGD